MSLFELLYLVDGYLQQKPKKVIIKDFKIDSRKVTKNDVFIAIKGNVDGHRYIDAAVNNKASVIIAEHEVDVKIPVIVVNSTRDALLKIALHKKELFNIPIIAVTGSVGKTSTKELISEILKIKFNVLKSYGNYNNSLGMPLTLLEANKNHSIAVLELGMNHLGEMNVLSKYTKPTISVITNIGTSHIGNIGSKKNILLAKKEILNSNLKQLLIINGDDKLLATIDYHNIIKCGINKTNDLKPYNITASFKGSYFTIKHNYKEYVFHTNIPGIFFINNILLAIKVGLLYNIDINKMIEVIEKYKPLDKRINITNIKNTVLIDDCYNSSYESLMAIISILKNEKKTKILILGDILELGTFNKKIHNKIKRELYKLKDIHIFTVGDNMKKIGINFNNNKDLEEYLELVDFDDKIILIKGSRMMKLEEIKEYIKKTI